MTTRTVVPAALATLLALPFSPALAQDAGWRVTSATCDHDWGGSQERACEARVAEFTDPGSITVDGGRNGGVNVRGWDRPEVRVTAEVWGTASSLDRARELVGGVTVSLDDGAIRPEGPSTGRRESWGVSFEIMVPRETDVEVETHNGGVGIDGVRGRIGFSVVNGGVALTDLAGDVRGHTRNGGLVVRLSGRTWQGRGLDVETTNGGVEVEVPEGYSANFETGTVNGRYEFDFPVTVQGRLGREVRTVLGNGGPEVRVRTTNGSVRVTRR